MTLKFLSWVQTALLSATYDNTILKTKQVIYLESLYGKKFARGSAPTGYEKSFAGAKSGFAYTPRVQFMRNKVGFITRVAPPRRQFKCYYVISRFAYFIGRCTINQARSERSLSCIIQYYFFGCCWHFQIPAPSADNYKRGNKRSGAPTDWRLS